MFCLQARRGTIFRLQGVTEELCRRPRRQTDDFRDALPWRMNWGAAGKSVPRLAMKDTVFDHFFRAAMPTGRRLTAIGTNISVG